MTVRRYGDWSEVARLLVCCLFEHFPYRQMTMVWRLQGLWQYLRGDVQWGAIKRVGLSADAESEQLSLREQMQAEAKARSTPRPV